MRIVAVYGTEGGAAYSFSAFDTEEEAWAWLDAMHKHDPSSYVAPQPQRIATGREAEQLLRELDKYRGCEPDPAFWAPATAWWEGS